MKRFKKAVSILLTAALSAATFAGFTFVSVAAGESVSAEVQGSYTQSTEAQDITVRVSVSGLTTPYCSFGFEGGTTVPEGFAVKSFSTSNTAQEITSGDYNLSNGKLTYTTSDTEDTIPGDTYYDMVVTAPSNASGEYDIVFNKVKIFNQYGTNELVGVDKVTAKLTIAEATSATPGYTVALSSDAPAEGVAKGEPFNINLNVSNTEATTFNAFSGILSYDKSKVSYTGNDTIGEFGVVNDSDAGTLKITRANQDVDISKDPDLSLPFKSEAAGDAVFELTSASVKVDEAANAEGQDAPAAAVEGSPLTVKVLETYTITFAGGEGATGTAPTKDPVPAGTKIELPDNTFTKEGWTFSKWSDGSSEYAEKAEYTMPAGNVTFTAQWTEDIAVTPASANPTAYFGSQYKLIAATINASGYVPTYDGNEMFQVQGYDDNTWYYVIDGTYDSSKFGYTAGTGVTIQKPDNDVNQTGIVDINDAQFVYNIYNGTAPTQNIVQRLLLADTNRDKTVNTQDCAVVVQAI